MHDPMTVVCDIKRPWPRLTRAGVERKHWGWFYWPTWITVWHVDPERDGSDDSCGWSSPKLTKAQISDLAFFAGCEARDPWLLRDRGKQPNNAAEAEAKLIYAIEMVAQRLNVAISSREAVKWAAHLLHNPIDNVRGSLCHLPGWHTNNHEDNEDDRRERALSLYCLLARFILRQRRPWYRHPRFHVWHWKIQIHPVQAFKRWAFSRCAGCGKRFRYGYSPVSGSWYGEGPRWFRRESHVYHSECFPRPEQTVKASSVIPEGV